VYCDTSTLVLTCNLGKPSQSVNTLEFDTAVCVILVCNVSTLEDELVYQNVEEPVTLLPLRFIQEFFAAAHDEAEARPVVIGDAVLSSTVAVCSITDVDLT